MASLCPSPRRGGTATAVRDSESGETYVVVLCGSTANGAVSDLTILRPGPTGLVWEVPKKITGAAPVPCFQHTATLAEDGNIYVYGGTNGEGQFFNETYVLNAATCAWNKPRLRGMHPIARAGHSATLVGSRIFYIGGYYFMKTQPFDVSIFDTKSLQWSQLSAINVPPPRHSHSATLIGASTLLVFGGFANNNALNDVHTLDTETMIWTERSTGGAVPSPRGEHAAFNPPGTSLLVIVGGKTGKKSYDGEIFALDTSTWQWQAWGSLAGRGGPATLASGAYCVVSALDGLIFGGTSNGATWLDSLVMVDFGEGAGGGGGGGGAGGSGSGADAAAAAAVVEERRGGEAGSSEDATARGTPSAGGGLGGTQGSSLSSSALLSSSSLSSPTATATTTPSSSSSSSSLSSPSSSFGAATTRPSPSTADAPQHQGVVEVVIEEEDDGDEPPPVIVEEEEIVYEDVIEPAQPLEVSQEVIALQEALAAAAAELAAAEEEARRSEAASLEAEEKAADAEFEAMRAEQDPSSLIVPQATVTAGDSEDSESVADLAAKEALATQLADLERRKRIATARTSEAVSSSAALQARIEKAHSETLASKAVLADMEAQTEAVIAMETQIASLEAKIKSSAAALEAAHSINTEVKELYDEQMRLEEELSALAEKLADDIINQDTLIQNLEDEYLLTQDEYENETPLLKNTLANLLTRAESQGKGTAAATLLANAQLSADTEAARKKLDQELSRTAEAEAETAALKARIDSTQRELESLHKESEANASAKAEVGDTLLRRIAKLEAMEEALKASEANGHKARLLVVKLKAQQDFTNESIIQSQEAVAKAAAKREDLVAQIAAMEEMTAKVEAQRRSLISLAKLRSNQLATVAAAVEVALAATGSDIEPASAEEFVKPVLVALEAIVVENQLP